MWRVFRSHKGAVSTILFHLGGQFCSLLFIVILFLHGGVMCEFNVLYYRDLCPYNIRSIAIRSPRPLNGFTRTGEARDLLRMRSPTGLLHLLLVHLGNP